jgi:hypothetical protein
VCEQRHHLDMPRVSTEHQDLNGSAAVSVALGVGDVRIHGDHGLTGVNRDTPGHGSQLLPAIVRS